MRRKEKRKIKSKGRTERANLAKILSNVAKVKKEMNNGRRKEDTAVENSDGSV